MTLAIDVTVVALELAKPDHVTLDVDRKHGRSIVSPT
jgi:hypothetical protein